MSYLGFHASFKDNLKVTRSNKPVAVDYLRGFNLIKLVAADFANSAENAGTVTPIFNKIVLIYDSVKSVKDAVSGNGYWETVRHYGVINSEVFISLKDGVKRGH